MILLVETQINASLLNKTYNIPDSLFTPDTFISVHNNNENKLISKHQQSEIMIAVKDEYYKLVKLTATDPSDLSR